MLNRPALRDRMISRQDLYCTDHFMQSYVHKIRFRWPHAWEDAVVMKDDGLMMGFSTEFLNRLMDIRCWAFEKDFTLMFPDIADDVIIYDPRPAVISEHVEDDLEESRKNNGSYDVRDLQDM